MRPSRPGQKEPNAGPGYLAQQVTLLRHKWGLSQWDLSVRSGLTYRVVCSVERGEREFVSVRTLVALAGALGVPIAASQGSPDSPGERMRAARQQLGISQRTLSLLSGVSLSYISVLERGQSSFSSLSAADAVASVLGLAGWDLLLWRVENHGDDAGMGDGNS